jgi:hypothetical protein
MRCTLLLLLGVASLGVVSGQQIGFSGPIEGFTFDLPTASLRAVTGTPGSALFGPALLDRLDFGSVAPHQNYAIAVQGENCLLVSNLGSDRISTSRISPVSRRLDAITWSGDGSLAILYSRSGNWIQEISGLPGNPSVGPYQELSSLGGLLSAVAAGQQGKQVAIAVTGNSAGVYLLTDSQAFAPVLQLSNPIALAFSSDGTSLFVLDASAMQLSILNLASLSSQAIPLAGLADPFAIQSAPETQNRQLVYVASRSDQLLQEYDIASQQVVLELPLYSSPTGIDEFGQNSFLIRSRLQAGDPLWLLTSSPQPAVYFVPAIQSDSGGNQGIRGGRNR